MKASISSQANVSGRPTPTTSRRQVSSRQIDFLRRPDEKLRSFAPRAQGVEQEPSSSEVVSFSDVDVAANDDFQVDVTTVRKALGVDYGQRFTGLATSVGGMAPRPLKVIATQNPWQKTAIEVVEIGVQEQVDGIIVGMPVTLRGNILDRESDSRQGRRCRNFGLTLALIAARKDLKVYLYDEQFSTQSAFTDSFDSIIAEHTRVSSRDEYSFGGGGSNRSRRKKSRKRTTSNANSKGFVATSKGRVDAQAAASILRAYYGDPQLAVLVEP
ncbi:hypothetical protein BSKO_00073 [Bryopsis sp. KO-2023]|nr:hypothetical protein BSKO_00073 [Bryopsis sp. KO-2023]